MDDSLNVLNEQEETSETNTKVFEFQPGATPKRTYRYCKLIDLEEYDSNNSSGGQN